MSWITPRIWRSAESRFNEDEPLKSADVYTPEVLKNIRRQGFDAIWMRGRLWELIRSELYPELNDAEASRRISNLKKVIAGGKEYGVEVFLYFNEPLALPKDRDFWRRHPALAGEPHREFESGVEVLSLCTSTSKFKEFFNESVRNLFDDLAGLGGVILITASEYQTHCWSHRAKRKIGDPFIDQCLVDVQCPNCRDREPADVVAELVNVWKQQAERTDPRPRVWVWNWSWSMWYDEPQREVIERLPAGVELMCDLERGGFRRQDIGNVLIDEYSLGYTGPSERFMGAKGAADARSLPVCAKLQIGTTHELATVPNLPLIPNLFDKLRRIDELGLNGLMCSWNLGNTPTLNTTAFGMFVDRPPLRRDKENFLRTLAEEYFGPVDRQKIVNAWKLFCDSFEQYPFSIKMLYFSPMNYAVAYPLRLSYEDRPMGPAWIPHSPWGDRLEDCAEPFTIPQVRRCFERMEVLWNRGLELYASALGDTNNRRQVEELSCAKMIGCHLEAMRNIFDFHQWRRGKMRESSLRAPCRLAADERALELIRRHMRTCRAALELSRLDSRLGYHQEPHAYFYDADAIEAVITQCSHAV